MSKAKKTPDFGALLNRSGFSTTKTELPADEAVRVISLKLDDINSFALNPRRAENPKYEEIKESIRAIGLENPLTVTKRPGEAGYTLYNGGNTRLKILKELWTQTQDEKYFVQDCRLIKWHSDSETLIRHMIENEVRGDMLLIDKALAATQIKTLHEQETGETLSIRRLSELLNQEGWQIKKTVLSLYIFAADKLADKLPLAFANGMGRPKLEILRKTYHAIKTYVDGKLPELDGPALQQEYLNALAQYDDETLMYERYALESVCRRIGAHYDIDMARVLFEIDYVMEHGQLYDQVSTSADFNDLGQPIHNNSGNLPSCAPHSKKAEASETVEDHTDQTDSKDIDIDIDIDPNSVGGLAQTIKEQIRYLRMRYPIVEEILSELGELPYFSVNADIVSSLRLHIGDSAQPEKCVVLLLIYDLACAYVGELRKNDSSNAALWQNLYKDLLEMCVDIHPLRIQIGKIRYGFVDTDDKDEARKVMDAQILFDEFGQTMRELAQRLQGA